MDNINYLFNKYVVGQNVEALSQEDKNAQLIKAVKYGQKEDVNALIKAGADLSIDDNGCSKALCAAASKGRTDIVELLIQNGVNLNWMAANIAIIHNHPSTAIRLFWNMSLEEIGRKGASWELFNEVRQEIENKSKKKIYDIIMPSVKILSGSPFLETDNKPFPKEVAERIFALVAALQVQSEDFPVWYRNCVSSDLEKTIQFKIDKKVPILTFSNANTNKRKADVDLEKQDNTKKIKITSSGLSNDEEMQIENNSSCTIS